MGTAAAALDVFRGWLAQGIREDPPGSNRTPIGVEFGWNGVAWCAEAASVALARTGTRGLWSASCYALIDALRAQGRWHGPNRPVVGALAFYSSGEYPNGGAHVNIVESVAGGRMTCIGGNERDSVMRSSRSVASAHGFGLPAYSGDLIVNLEVFRMGEQGMAVHTVMHPTRIGMGYTLDRSGGVHSIGGAPALSVGKGWPGADVARCLVVQTWKPDGSFSGYVQDLYGGLHPIGGAAKVTGGFYMAGAPADTPRA